MLLAKDMKAVILAGGFGTRLAEETDRIPKPLVKIGKHPIIWHIMKLFSHYGVNEFFICLGYKGHSIKEYFLNLRNYDADITVTTGANFRVDYLSLPIENWRVHLIDTGEQTMTGGRLLRLRKFLTLEKYFFFTYGDGLSNINLDDLLRFHQKHGGLATVTSVTPPGRFGAILTGKNENVTSFHEKPAGDGLRVNGGYFVLDPAVFNLIDDDQTVWEQEPIQNLVKNDNLYAFNHAGFWRPMDTLSDKRELNYLWHQNKAPWKVW